MPHAGLGYSAASRLMPVSGQGGPGRFGRVPMAAMTRGHPAVRRATAPPRCSSPSADSRTPGAGLPRRCRSVRPVASTCPPGACAGGRRPAPSNTGATRRPRAAGEGCGGRRSAFMFLASGQDPAFEQACPLCPDFFRSILRCGLSKWRYRWSEGDPKRPFGSGSKRGSPSPTMSIRMP